MTNLEFPNISTTGCMAHILNLTIRDVFGKIRSAKAALAALNEMIQIGILNRYSAVRWTSRFDSLVTALSRNIGDENEKILFEQTKLMLGEICKQIMILQRDDSTIYQAITALAQISLSWDNNRIIDSETNNQLQEIFKKRSKMFFTSHLGDIALSRNRFLDLGEQEQIILRQFNSNKQQSAICAMGRGRFPSDKKRRISERSNRNSR